MPNINDAGAITTDDGTPVDSGGDLSEAEFNARLAAKVGKQQPRASAAPEPEPMYPQTQSAEEWREDARRSFGPEGSEANVEQGLEYADDERAAIRREYEESLRAISIDPNSKPEPPSTQAPAKPQVSEDYVQRVELGLYNALLEEDSGTALEEARRLTALQGIEGLDDFLERVEASWAEQFPNEDIDLSSIRGAVIEAAVTEKRESLDAEIALKEAIHNNTRIAATMKALETWAHEQNLDLQGDNETDEYLGSLFERDQVMHEEYFEPSNEIEAEIAAGPPITSLEPTELLDRIKILDALNDEEEYQEKVRAFKQQIVGTETASVSEGLTTAETEKAAEQAETNRLLRKLVGEDGARQVDPDRVRARLRGQKLTTVGDFRRAITAPDPTDWREGLTDAKGRKVDVYDATGERERAKKERAEERARGRR
jgi:hypothetical protein